MTGRPGEHPEPPADLAERSLLLSTLKEGEVVYRLHGVDRDPLYFGRTGNNRLDAPDGSFGVLDSMTCNNAERPLLSTQPLLDGERVRDRGSREFSGTEFRGFRGETTPSSASMDRQDSSAVDICGLIRRARPVEGVISFVAKPCRETVCSTLDETR